MLMISWGIKIYGGQKMELKVSEKKGVNIQKDLIGIFFEDINYGADGGLYAEMIENRSFEFLDARGDKDAYYQIFDGMYGWQKWQNNEEIHMEIKEDKPLNSVNPHYLHVCAEKGSAFTNKAYDGIYVIEKEAYEISFYARSKQTAVVKLAVISEGQIVATFGEIRIMSNEWEKYTITYTSEKTIRHALFAIVFVDTAEVDFDCISMFPNNAICGVFRKDLAEKLKELHPGFIRFPGGCVVEGNELTNRYQWKNSVGDITQRKANWNRWAVHENNKENNFTSKFSHYNQTLGLGYYEYFLLCEYVGAKPLPVANVGLACQYQSSQLVKRGTADYQKYIQDVLDLIEFANGDVDTKWGGLRAKMGHPQTFGLEMIGIGNEQWQTEKVDFFERYDDFEKAIHEKYPSMKLIASAGPTVNTPTYDAAWKNIYEKAKDHDGYTYAVDEHYYMEPEWFIKNTHFYDKYPRDVKVFSGEYAAHDRDVAKLEHRNNWWSALAEAAFLTGVERNADVVYLASYAPLFARIGYTQWGPDLIWFDDATCYGTPNFYVQKMFREYTGTITLHSELEKGEENLVFHVVSLDEEDKKVYIKLVNAAEEERNLSLQLSGELLTCLGKSVKVEKTILHAELKEVNSVNTPTQIVPKKETVVSKNLSHFELVLPRQSFTVLTISGEPE